MKIAIVFTSIAALVSACSGATSAPSSLAGQTTTGASVADLAFCVQNINSYRARVGSRTNYAESAALETFAAAGAQADSLSDQAHGHFEANIGAGIALAENEVVNASFTTGNSVQGVIQSVNAEFFSEGPGGGHYEHLVSVTLSQVGCGIYIGGGRITVTEDFR
jgi:hypothetical protein